MNLSELQNLDPQNIGNWPAFAQTLVLVILFVVILGAGWYFDTQNQQQVLVTAEKKEVDLKQSFEFKQKKAANLGALKRQMALMKETFGELLQSLPDKTEVAELLQEISQQGLATGLEFELFKPGKEQQTEFYVELPIKIRVTGDYHQFGEFVSGVADLERIVTQHNVIIRPEGKDGGLVLETTAKTYRYIDEDEEE